MAGRRRSEGGRTGSSPLQAARESAGGSRPAINPSIAALRLLAAMLMGGWIRIFANADTFVGLGSSGMPAQFLVFTFAPYMVFAGLAALISLLPWHGLQWQRKRGQEAAPERDGRRKAAFRGCVGDHSGFARLLVSMLRYGGK